MQELPLYQGARPQAPQQQMPTMPQLPHVQGMGQIVDNAISQGMQALMDYSDLHDFGVEQEAERQRRENDDKMQLEFQRRMELAPGAEGGFYNAEGHLDEDALQAFAGSWQEKNDQIARPFWLRKNAMRADAGIQQHNGNLGSRVLLMAAKKESEHRERLFQDNFALAYERGDVAGGAALVSRAVEAGQITSSRGELMKLKLARKQLRGLGDTQSYIRIGDKEYHGLSAALAASAARNGHMPSPAVNTTPETAPPAEQENVAASPAPPTDQELADQASAKMRSVVAAWEQSGDFGGVFKSLADSEFAKITNSISPESRVVRNERPDGKPTYTCSPAAPEPVARMVADANERGEIDKDTALGMVARMTLDEVANRPYTSADDLVKVFDESGIYSAIGDGDENLGKARVGGIIREYQERAKQGTLKLSTDNIDKLVKARVAEPDFGAGLGLEWKQMESLNPGREPGKDYDKPDDEAGLARWFELYHLYEKYRPQFRPQLTNAVDQDEFEEKAQEFWDWYMGPSHLYSDTQKASREAAADWYKAQIAVRLQESVQPGKDGKPALEGYANDYSVARAVLSEQPPSDLGVQARAQWREQAEQANAELSESLRKRAKSDAARFMALKKAAAESKAQETAAEKEREKTTKEKEKRAAIAETRRMNVARHTPVTLPWAWDGEDAADGEMPACTIPEEEYRRLTEELGYDGSQDVYLRIQGTTVQVVGVNKLGRVLLNTTAATKAQRKPNVRRGEKWRTRGDLQYSYQFKALRS